MKIKLFIFLSILVLSLNAQEAIVLDKIVAQIGGEIILLSDISTQVVAAKSQGAPIDDNFSCNIFGQLISQKLLLNQAKLDSIEVTSDEVEAQLNARIERILSYMGGDVGQFEDYYGQSINEVKTQFRNELKSQILTERMQGSIFQDVEITPKEVKSFFQSIPVDSLPYFNSEVELKEIVYYPKVNAIEKQKALDLANHILKKLHENEKFEELAAKYSADPGSGRAGGDLGWAKRGSYVTDFEAIAYSLEKDEISKPVETEFGFHIIQMLERRGNSIHLRHILIKPEITADDIALTRNFLDSIRQNIIDSTMSIIFAVKQHSHKKEQSYNNSGNMINGKTGNTFFEIGDLDPDIYFTIDTLKIDEISSPIKFTSPRDETGFRIVQLKSRTNPHVASLSTDYSKIQQAALDSKKNIYISNWVKEHSKFTFLEVANEFKTCPMVQSWLYNKKSVETGQ